MRIWDAQTGEALRTLEGHTGIIWKVAFNSEGTRLLSASWDKTVKVWDTTSGRALRTFSGHKAMVHTVAFSPDGKRVASGSLDAFVKIWNPETGEVLATYEGGLFPFSSVAFSPDGKRLAMGSTDRTITLWDTVTGRDLYKLSGHGGAIPNLAFSPDGKRLVTASWDYILKIWHVDPERKESLFSTRDRHLLTLKGHADQVNGVAFSPDGTRSPSAQTQLGESGQSLCLGPRRGERSAVSPPEHRQTSPAHSGCSDVPGNAAAISIQQPGRILWPTLLSEPFLCVNKES